MAVRATHPFGKANINPGFPIAVTRCRLCIRHGKLNRSWASYWRAGNRAGSAAATNASRRSPASQCWPTQSTDWHPQVDSVLILNANGDPGQGSRSYGLPVDSPIRLMIFQGRWPASSPGLEYAAARGPARAGSSTAATDSRRCFQADLVRAPCSAALDDRYRAPSRLPSPLCDGQIHPTFGLWPTALAALICVMRWRPARAASCLGPTNTTARLWISARLRDGRRWPTTPIHSSMSTRKTICSSAEEPCWPASRRSPRQLCTHRAERPGEAIAHEPARSLDQTRRLPPIVETLYPALIARLKLPPIAQLADQTTAPAKPRRVRGSPQR